MRCTRCGSMIGPTSPSCETCGAAVTPVPPAGAATTWSHGAQPDAATVPPIGAAPPPAPPENPWSIPAPGAEWSVPGQPAPLGAQTPAQPYGYGYARPRDAGSAYSIGGIVCGVIALLFCPIVMGLIGLGLAGKASKRGESLAGVARLVSIVGLIGGIIIGAWVVSRSGFAAT